MGSFRTWSLALIAGIFVIIVAHQRSIADAGVAGPGPASWEKIRDLVYENRGA